MRVMLQAAEGLKPFLLERIKELEAEGKEVVLSAKPTYGACDLAIDEARMIGAQRLIHVGHFAFTKTDFPVSYEVVEQRLERRVLDGCVQLLKERGVKRVSLVAISQYVHLLDEWEKVLKTQGFEVILKHNKRGGVRGLVLGCDPSAVDVSAEVVVLLANGWFHAKALSSLVDEVNVIVCGQGGCKDVSEVLKRWEKKRKALLVKAYDAQRFGVLVSTKVGQRTMNVAERIVKTLREQGKEAWLIVGDELSASTLFNFSFIDVFITTACPRLVDDGIVNGLVVLDVPLFEQLMGMWTKVLKKDS